MKIILDKIKFSVDDGCASDLHLAILLEKYGQKMTIYLPVEWQRLAYENGYLSLTYFGVGNLLHRGHELGAHGITHQHLTKIDNDTRLTLEIAGGKLILEAMFGQPIKDFCPPRGYTNEQIDKIIYEYYDGRRLTKGNGLVHIHPDSGANDNEPWQARIDENTTELWCHSWELDKYDLWGELEEWLRENSDR